MSLNSKTHIPDGTWTLTGTAALVGSQIKVAALAAYFDDFESTAVGVVPTGWIEVAGTFTAQDQGGQRCARISGAGWQGAYYNPTNFNAGCMEVELVVISDRANLVLNFDPAATEGYMNQFLPGLQDSLWIGGVPSNFVGVFGPQLVLRGNTAENPTLPFIKKLHKFVRGDGTVEMRGWISDDLKFDVLDFWAKWGTNKMAVQGNNGNTFYGFIKFFNIETGGFSKIFTPFSVTSLSRIGLSSQIEASRRKSLSELLEYNIDGGGWVAVPDDGLINTAATTTIGVRASSTLENDFDASKDILIDAIEIEIDGEWDAPAVGPDPPTSLAVEAASRTVARVTWIDAATGAFYRVYFNDVNNFATATIGAFASQGAQVATIPALTPSQQYWFWIVTEDASGNSSTTEGPVTVTMPAPASDTLDIDQLRDALHDWAAAVSLIEVIFANEDGPRPAPPFVTLNILGPRMTGGSDHQSDQGLGDQGFIQQGMREFTVSVNAYADNDSLTVATKLHSSLNNPIYIDQLEAEGVGIGAVNQVIDLSEFLETEWERRSQFDFIIFVALNEEYNSEVIETVDFENNILP